MLLLSIILEPNAEVVKGFNKGLMQSYKDKISAADLDKIVDYFKTSVEKRKQTSGYSYWQF